MLNELLKKLLRGRDFLFVATADPQGTPNVAPKQLIKLEEGYLYFADYVIGKTWENLQGNARVAASFMEEETRVGYQIKGVVTLLTIGSEFESIIHGLQERQVNEMVERVIEGVRRARRHAHFDFGQPENSVILKVKVEELVEIGPTGSLKRAQV